MDKFENYVCAVSQIALQLENRHMVHSLLFLLHFQALLNLFNTPNYYRTIILILFVFFLEQLYMTLMFVGGCSAGSCQ